MTADLGQFFEIDQIFRIRIDSPCQIDLVGGFFLDVVGNVDLRDRQGFDQSDRVFRTRTVSTRGSDSSLIASGIVFTATFLPAGADISNVWVVSGSLASLSLATTIRLTSR